MPSLPSIAAKCSWGVMENGFWCGCDKQADCTRLEFRGSSEHLSTKMVPTDLAEAASKRCRGSGSGFRFYCSEVRPQELAARLDLMRIYVGHLVGHLERMELKPSSRQSCGSGLLG